MPESDSEEIFQPYNPYSLFHAPDIGQVFDVSWLYEGLHTAFYLHPIYLLAGKDGVSYGYVPDNGSILEGELMGLPGAGPEMPLGNSIPGPENSHYWTVAFAHQLRAYPETEIAHNQYLNEVTGNNYIRDYTSRAPLPMPEARTLTDDTIEQLVQDTTPQPDADSDRDVMARARDLFEGYKKNGFSDDVVRGFHQMAAQDRGFPFDNVCRYYLGMHYFNLPNWLLCCDQRQKQYYSTHYYHLNLAFLDMSFGYAPVWDCVLTEKERYSVEPTSENRQEFTVTKNKRGATEVLGAGPTPYDALDSMGLRMRSFDTISRFSMERGDIVMRRRQILDIWMQVKGVPGRQNRYEESL